jgi:hypothetical protein
MASTSLAADNRPNLPAPTEASGADGDPFMMSDASATPAHHRYSAFDQDLFAAGPGSSPRQAKRALEAHLAETDRRLDDAGKLGTALVSQRKALIEQLQEVEKLQAEGELGPELKQKLIEIEKEYNDLARESARAFLPKQRVPSNETNPGSPFVPEGRSGRRSVSPSKFESQATGSPTKLSVPNRKIRNQPSNRVHDIQFAADISTSLLSQVRDLQSLLAEREEEVRELKNDKSALEIESESLQQRIKALDESEHRYKEENWNLETRLQETSSQQREASDREKKLTQALGSSNTEKNATQKELDEAKLALAKLVEEHAAAIKQHDIELGTAKRNMVMGEGERSALQRKIDDLTSQNQELAKAFSAQRGRALEREPASGQSEEEFETATDNATPENSPPPSPVKGTPRHSMLETETIKTSLHHAQRTIQSQRGQIHREKTEKLELRRIIQDLRDDLERARGDSGNSSNNRRSRKVDPKELKKQSRLLGSFRSSRQEIITDDPEWEDNAEHSPRTSSANASPTLPTTEGDGLRHDSTDHFDTANEASESAFETANEHGTETEDFQTGNEAMSGSDGAETETEGTSRGFGKMKRPPSLPAGLSRHVTRDSIHSTASTSADEDDFGESKTPTSTISRNSRFRLSRGPFGRNSRQISEEPGIHSSPTAVPGSHQGTPQGAQSLFAELQDFEGSDEESVGVNTPSRRSARSVTPGSIRRPLSPPPAVPALPKVVMVDSGVMTDPIDFAEDLRPLAPSVNVDEVSRPMSMESVIGPAGGRGLLSWPSNPEEGEAGSRPVSTFSYSDASVQHEHDMEAKLAQFPVPPSSSPIAPPTLSMSAIQSEIVDPREEPEVPPTPITLAFAPIQTEHVEPLAEPETPKPALGISTIIAEALEPRAEPEPPAPDLNMTSIWTQEVEPIAEPEIPAPELHMTSILTQHVAPIAEPETPAPELRMTSILMQQVEPIAEPEAAIPPLPALSLSTISGENIEPVIEPEVEEHRSIAVPVVPEPVVPPPPELSMSSISMENVEPVSEPEVIVPPASLNLSSVYSEHVEPREEPEVVSEPIPLAYSVISTQHVEPISEPQPLPQILVMSPIAAENVSPVVELPPALPTLALSSIAAEDVSPISPAQPNFGFSTIESIETEPLPPRSPWRDAFILPRDNDAAPETPRTRAFDSLLGWARSKDSSPIIAEDETRQSPGRSDEPGTPESQRPFKEISANGNVRHDRTMTIPMSDQGAQTSLTAEEIDRLVNAGSRPGLGHQKQSSVSSVGTPGTTGTVRIHRSRERSGSPTPDRMRKQDDVSESGSIRRPGSAASGRTSLQDAPPLPANHRELIEAARTGSSQGNMGPPLWPASAMKNRPRTPSLQRPTSGHSGRGTPTPRAARGQTPRVEVHSPTRMTGRSRQSSVSSFASELDNRFNMRPGEMDHAGLGPNTDPRMIQAITQTMIGEYLWKYTRKTGRGEMSEKRHRRYFWMHPYTRTLYWSDEDPSSAGRAERKAKSVPIEAVRVVTDDNPMPPGLHRKSLIVIAPGRTVKFTCTTGQRHETWFNALSYLLLRTNADGQADTEEVAGNITREDVDEFNPQYGQRPANGNRPRAPPSLSSYNSRTTHDQSPSAADVSIGIPTLTPSRGNSQSQGQRAPTGTLNKFSGYWRTSGSKFSGTFGSLRGRAPSNPNQSIYEASEVHDSAEDLREMIERQDRESDRLENVRACCDGKHDVGTLPHMSRKNHRNAHTHAHPSHSTTNTPSASMRSRA